MHKKEEWNSCKNILCVRPDNMGDVLMTSPAIRALKKSVPGRKITLLTSGAGSAIAKFIPEIDEVTTFDIPWYKHEKVGAQEDVYAVIEEIKAGKFDAAVIFTVFSQSPLPSAMLCYMAGVPKIAGYCRENPYKLLSDWIPDKEPLYEIKHEVDRQLDMVKHIGATYTEDHLSLSINETIKSAVGEKLVEIGLEPGKPWLIVHPGVSEAKRQYPVDLFTEVVNSLTTTLGYQVLLTGVASEGHLAGQIMEVAGEKNVFSLMGRLNIEELIAAIDLAPLLISNNTGPVHIAAAVNTPMVVLYAKTNPQHTPWKVPHKVLTFDVPEASRSKNVIIKKANESGFRKSKAMVQPWEVVDAAKVLLSESDLTFRKRPSALDLKLQKQAILGE